MPLVTSDSRRQTGAGRLLDSPGAALEAHIPPEITDAFEAAWRRHVRALAAAAGWPGDGDSETEFAARRFATSPLGPGLSLALSAPPDALYAAVEANEAAAALAWADVSPDERDAQADLFGDALARVRDLVARDADRRLSNVLAAAKNLHAAVLWDAEAVTVGLGAGSQTWATGTVPLVCDVPWNGLHAVPTVLVTGTNGKSTTVRMIAAMARAAGHTPGVSTTDYVVVGTDVIETGDFSGPMGARAALRDRRATLGILEVARGGLLRRGVPVTEAAVAAVTNVASDHLGEFGIDTVEALAEAKFVVAKALARGGQLVLSADDAASAREADRQATALAARGVSVCWVALDPAEPRLAGSAIAASVADGHIATRLADGPWTPLVALRDAPSTAGGAARHNVRNALTAAAAATALGLPGAAIAAGLRAFRGDAGDNPGRGNQTDVRGATVVVDYGHNAHGTAALVEYALTLPAVRRLVLVSCAGDRSDADIRALAAAARAFGADRTLAADLPDYLRGRAPGEVPGLLVAETLALGAPPGSAEAFPDPPAAARAALAWARRGDVLLLFVLSHRAEVSTLVEEAAGSGQ